MQFLDLTKQHKPIHKKIQKAISDALENSSFIGGGQLDKFEESVSKFCGTKYAIGVNSGTDAIFLALKTLNLNENDEVITTPFTFVATAEAIVNAGAKPIFVDVDKNTYNINTSLIEQKITKNTKAIIPVHLFGQMADIEKIKRIAKKHNLYVIEDAAQAFGARYNNKSAGSFGDFGCFSFFPSKNLGCLGDGGMIVTNNEKFIDQIKMLKNHGSSVKDKYLNVVLGVNSRLDNIQAAVLNIKLNYLEKWNEQRANAARIYNELLKDVNNIELPKIYPGKNFHSFNQYTIRVKEKRDDLAVFLKNKGISTMVYYKLPLHLQPAFSYLGYKEGSMPVSEKLSKEVLSLPIYPGISKSDQKEVADNIKKFFK